ncbi:MAG: transposase [Thermodesulfobacteriota bacterium]|nr:transposase [Thermodesulfobacteriota bacterium]
MKYNPDIHHRRSIRLKDYDYAQSGAYFITICTRNRMLYFSQYLDLTHIVTHQWQEIPNRYENVILDEFVIMPNHIHGIITVGAGLAPAPDITPTPAGLGIDARPGADTKPGAGVKPAPTSNPFPGTEVCL